MKQIAIAVITIAMIALHTQANAQGIGGLMETVERSMPVLERIAAADEDDLRAHCVGDQECMEGMARDVEALNTALDILKDQQRAYKANAAAFRAQERLLRGE